ncbi:hypothetical protein HQ886_05595 [Enterococcus faecium]|jgi:hypothetical protein|uniref:hypothetical protein n=1 Tax=unclassified Enterococcus TaxID=2608891 RepID=UPI00384925DF|nr:hypothetical protein [Enterococcus faecium]HBK4031848.1 hypothetical protein [Enterococcus faecium]
MKIITNKNCNNSPKNKFIETYSINLLLKNLSELKADSTKHISIILPDGMEINDLVDIEKWSIEAETITSVASASHGKQAFFLALLTNKNRENYITIYYEFKTHKANKMEKIILFEGHMLNRLP